MAAYKKTTGVMRDRGVRLEFDGKDIRGTNGTEIFTRATQLFDHFQYGAGAFNSHVPQNWVTTETGAATPYAPGAAAIGGLAIAVTGAVTDNAEELAGKDVAWKASTQALERPLSLEARVKSVGATTPTDGSFFIGFCNAVTTGAGITFAISAASAVTAPPTEFAGFGYSSIPSSGALFLAGGNPLFAISSKAAAAAQTVVSTVVKDSLFHIYRVEVDVNGDAWYFIDDKYVGQKANAVTAATALTPYISGLAKNSHTNTMTVDYIQVAGGLAA